MSAEAKLPLMLKLRFSTPKTAVPRSCRSGEGDYECGSEASANAEAQLQHSKNGCSPLLQVGRGRL